MTRAPTPGQTVGPFFGFALPYAGGGDLVPTGSPDAIQLSGTVLDGAAAPVPDALVEIRQTAPDGAVPVVPGHLHRDGSAFTGWGRASTDDAGYYAFSTLAPGAAPGKAAFFAVAVFARGLGTRLFTRAYLPDDADALAADPLLRALPADRRRTLVARRDGASLVFDIRLQGEGETVFLRYSDRP